MSIVILGGGYAGALAAARIGKKRPVTLIEQAEGLVERIRLHQVAAGDDIEPVPYERLFRGLDVDVVRGRVDRIDRTAKCVILTDGETVPYTELIYALGSAAAGPPDAFALQGPASAKALRRKLQGMENGRVAIVGGGLTGIELAAEVAERFPALDVSLVTRGTIGAGLSEKAARHLRDWFADHRVAVLEGHDGSGIAADLVVWCAGFGVATIARDAGLEVDGRGRIVVDEYLRSSDPSIFAVGDAAVVPFAQGELRMACATAMPMGAYAADFVLGATTEPFRFSFVTLCISLGRRDGIIQPRHPDDSSRGTALTGRAAAWCKELVCRFTILAIRLERIGVPYAWPKTTLKAA
jgi:NADH dehydrogenase